MISITEGYKGIADAPNTETKFLYHAYETYKVFEIFRMNTTF